MIDQFATRLLVICVLTDDCNQTCKYCSENAGLGNAKMLPYEIVDNLLKDIYEEGKSSGEHYGQAACAGRGKETDLEYIGLAFPC